MPELDTDPLTSGDLPVCGKGLENLPTERPPLIRLADDLQALCRGWEQARQRRQTAKAHGNAVAADEGLGEEWEAMGDIYECKDAIATTFVFMFRVALNLHPEEVA